MAEPASIAHQQASPVVALFDGSSLAAWRGYQLPHLPQGWVIEGETLMFNGKRGHGKSKNLITREKFGDFDLQLEWKISKGGNSGVMYLVSEDAPHPYFSGPEYQILDNKNHRAGDKKLHQTSALYALYPATTDPKPVGEWNSTRIRHKQGTIEHWLNGKLIVKAQIGNDDWNTRVANSKFKDRKRFGKNKAGHIALQDHGDEIWFRNIKIQRLE